jgi:hypothetical protein
MPSPTFAHSSRLFVLEYYRGKAAEKPSEMLDQQSPPTAPVLL